MLNCFVMRPEAIAEGLSRTAEVRLKRNPLLSEKCWTVVKPFPKAANMPTIGAVYMLMSAGEDVLYIGQTGNLRKRIAGHYRNRRWYGSVEFVLVLGESDRLAFERDLIEYFTPPQNHIFTGRYRPMDERPMVRF